MHFPISRVLSTQHPDNVSVPFFAEHEVMGDDDEVKEAFYSFSHLGIREQLWDTEGKEADAFVVKKLLSRYEPFFRKHPLGVDETISLRVPNPRVEKADAKVLIEALHGVTRSHDIAAAFYGEETAPPIPQVYVPMTRDAKDVLRVKAYYDQYIVKNQELPLLPGDARIKEWIGAFRPETVRVTPLVEEKEAILGSHRIAEELIAAKATNGDGFLRFWYARSDPALNYGSAATVLMLKVALQRIHAVEEKTGVEILPLIGCGSAPFRGNFTPKNVPGLLKGYPSIQTFTAQSSFKYDHPLDEVRNSITLMNESKRKRPYAVDEETLLPIIDKLAKAYKGHVKLIAPIVNRMAPNIPARRKRKMHIGLFGYARDGGGVTLPRAITYTAALYSLGLPPELLGLHILSDKELERVQEAWPNFLPDHEAAATYLNKENLSFFPRRIQGDVKAVMKRLPVERNSDHARITSIILQNFKKERHDLVRQDVVNAAFVRGFLG